MFPTTRFPRQISFTTLSKIKSDNMANLINSQRSLLKATYVPTQSKNGPPENTNRVVEKVAMIRQLNIQPSEFDRLAQDPAVLALRVTPGPVTDNPFSKRSFPLLDLVRVLVNDNSSVTTSRYAPLLASVSVTDLNVLGQALATERKRIADIADNRMTQIITSFHKENPKAKVNRKDAMVWAIKKDDPAALHLQNLVRSRASVKLEKLGDADTTVAFTDNAATDAADTLSIVNGFLDRFKVEPVGRLHLERIEMTPVGIEHGELVHSVPLTPHEKVNISHREWSTTTQTFENIVSDSFTGYSEQGVAEKTDISQATTNESRQQSSLDVNGSVSASYSGAGFSVTASTGVDYNTHSDDFKSVKDSLAHSVAVTRTASARSRKDHKISFRTSSVAGTEDLAVRTLENTTNNAVRVDYFQLMRKWKVDLIRYGLRMTYDIVIPNPGNDLVVKVKELYDLSQQISMPHVFTVQLIDITTSNWKNYEQAFGVELEPPPLDPFMIMMSGNLQPSIDKFFFGPIDFDVPDGYAITGGHFHAQVHLDGGNFNSGHRAQINLTGENAGPGTTPRIGNEFTTTDGALEVDLSVNTVVGHTGKISLLYNYYNVESGGWLLNIQASPTTEAIGNWQAKVWAQVRDADEARYQANLSKLNDRKEQLQKELGDFDALTLRRMEREEIMKGVLQWLFGPSFQLQPGVLDFILDDPDTSVFKSNNAGAWQAILSYGEYIKYIHNAIEWENVLFFPYPYFWDATTRWPFKMFLVHPDPTHRAFIRAGCARVVLTIRPGFEESFANFMETYSLTGVLTSTHPYISIGNEIRNFAMTNYEAIPPANPDKNVRPLLFPEQRKAWADMQKLILLIEQLNTTRHNITISAIAGAGSSQCTPSSMAGIEYGTPITVDSGANQETVTVIGTTANTFTAVFTLAHAANTAAVIDNSVNLYPKTLAELAPMVNNATLPLTDPWGNNFVYTCPGLHGDFDLVCLGMDNQPGGEGLDADINSWAEGSVVSTWYEYTPTGALDVVLNTALTTNPDPA